MVAVEGLKWPKMRVSKVVAGPRMAKAVAVVKILLLEAGRKSWAWLRPKMGVPSRVVTAMPQWARETAGSARRAAICWARGMSVAVG